MPHFPRVLCSVAGILYLASGPRLTAEPPPTNKADADKAAAAKFIRLKRDAKEQPIGLETATVRYVPASGDSGLTVDLVGVVHVADRSYYRKLDQQLDDYDVVLYELVAPQGTRIPRGGKASDNPVALLQQIGKVILDLDLQTERIDYTRKNFVHADLSPKEMAEAIHNRGDNGITLFLSIAADVLRQQNLQDLQKEKASGKGDDEDIDLFSMVFDPEAAVKLKRLMAKQMEALGSPDGGLGNTVGRILIADRNEAAMKVFQKELAKGKKKIAIFYGAAHMPDFDRRLKADFGLKRESTKWQTAWDLQKKGTGLEGLFRLLEP